MREIIVVPECSFDSHNPSNERVEFLIREFPARSGGDVNRFTFNRNSSDTKVTANINSLSKLRQRCCHRLPTLVTVKAVIKHPAFGNILPLDFDDDRLLRIPVGINPKSIADKVKIVSLEDGPIEDTPFHLTARPILNDVVLNMHSLIRLVCDS